MLRRPPRRHARPSLWIYDAAAARRPRARSARRSSGALEVKADSALAIDELVLVDAEQGTVALRIDQIEQAKNRGVCDANNATANAPVRRARSRTEGEAAESALADVDTAYEYAGDTYDFFSPASAATASTATACR